MHLIYKFVFVVIVASFSMQASAKDIHDCKATGNEKYKVSGWMPLFKTAKDTVNWMSIRKIPFPNDGWEIKKRELTLLPGKKGGDIVTKKKYADFELKLEFKMTRLVNSG